MHTWWAEGVFQMEMCVGETLACMSAQGKVSKERFTAEKRLEFERQVSGK